MSTRANVAYGGCAALVGASVVGCAGIGALTGVAALVVTTQWEDAARGVLEAQTGGEVTFDDLDVSWDRVALDGVRVRLGPAATDAEILRIDRVVVQGVGPRDFASDTLDAESIAVTGVHVALERGEDGWRVPPTTRALLASGSTYEWPAMHAARVDVDGVTLVATTPDGASTLTVAHLDAAALSASLRGGLTWSVREGDAQGLAAVRDGVQAPYATIAEVQAGADRVLTVAGLVVSFETAPDRSVDLPPALAEVAPTWMGGHHAAPDGAPWLGVQPLRGWPWAADQLVLVDATVTVTDDAYGPTPIPWAFGVSRATFGPVSPDGASLPVTAAGTLAGGEASVEAQVRREGAISGAVKLAGADATAFEPYLRATFRKASLSLGRGVVSARFDGTIDRSRLRASGTVSMSNLKFDAADQDDGGSAIVGLASKLFTANEDEPYTVGVSLDGSLDDPGFSPVKRTIAAIDASVGNKAVGAARGVVGGIERTWKKVFGGD